MQYVRAIAKNGHSWHVTLPRRELMRLKLTPGTLTLVEFDDRGVHIGPLPKPSELPLAFPDRQTDPRRDAP